MTSKLCTKCKSQKSRSEFHKRTASKDGLTPDCRVCRGRSAHAWSKKNSDRVKANYARWLKQNHERNRLYYKAYYQANKVKVLANVYKLRNRKLKEDPLYRATKALRNLTTQAFHRKGYKKRSKCNALLGCSFQIAKRFIEVQFLPGMSWANHGEWHIDHRVPLASAKTIADRERLCHYTNLQPLWAADNLRKHSKVAQ